MAIHVLRSRATAEQVREMLETLDTYVKVVVDVEFGILAGGGAMHADCEQVLMDQGSQQENLWGANWYSDSGDVEFQSLINIRPHQGNRSMIIQDSDLQRRVEAVISKVFGES